MHNNYVATDVAICGMHIYAILVTYEMLSVHIATSACRGSRVTISCSHSCTTPLLLTWIINGTLLTQQEVENSPLYHLNYVTVPLHYSLTVRSIDSTTTFKCTVQSTNPVCVHIRTESVTVTTGMYRTTL